MLLPDQSLPTSLAPTPVLAPAADLFARRAARLRQLADQDADGAGKWLHWLAELAQAQQAVVDTLPASTGMPPADDAWEVVYAALLRHLHATSLPTAADVAAAVPALRDYLRGNSGQGPHEVAEVILAAALQVVFTHAVRATPLPAVAEQRHDLCPCCGSAPLGSIVLAGDGRAGLRYLECSLCGSRWNAVRARCTLCDDDGVVSYLGLENGTDNKPAAVQAESCEHCHGYVKTFVQERDPQVEPLADDLATLALDVLVGEEGFQRGAPNPFLLLGGD